MFTSIKSKLGNYLNRYSVYKTRELMLQMDDEILQQAGISRQLLQRGTDYWPWQITDDAQPQAAKKPVTDTLTVVNPVADIAGTETAAATETSVAIEPTEKAA